jgi:hypothetical protein
MMISKNYTVSELKILLEGTHHDIQNILMNPSNANNNLYYENFTTISLRTLRYINHYLNRISSDQHLGALIESIITSLNDTLADYKGRNIFSESCTLSVYPGAADEDKEEDEIYHFMNTRNNSIPLECLGSPEMDRQRMELAEFVASMEKKTNPK